MSWFSNLSSALQTAAAIAGLLGFCVAVYRRLRSRPPYLKHPNVRNHIATYVEAILQQLSAQSDPGSAQIKTGDLTERDGLYIRLPWAIYSAQIAGCRSDDLIDYMLLRVQRGSSVLLLGEPGQGKTTVLKRLFFEMSRQFSESVADLLPVYVPLKDLNIAGWDFLVYVRLWFGLRFRHSPRFPVGVIRFLSLCARNDVVFLFDGFDEIVSQLDQSDINKLASCGLWSRLSVMSCRKTFYEFYSSSSALRDRYATRIELLPLDLRRHAEPYLHAFQTLEPRLSADEAVHAIESNATLQDLSKRPLLLTMIADVFIGEDVIESRSDRNLAVLYDKYTTKWLRNEAQKPNSLLSAEQKAELIEELAWSQYSPDIRSNSRGSPRIELRPTFKRDQISSCVSLCGPSVPLRQAVDDVCTRTFLIGSSRGSYYFVHLSFQEYYVARRLRAQMAGDCDSAATVLQRLIPVEPAQFLKDMFSPIYGVGGQEKAVKNLICAYDRFPSLAQQDVLGRQNAAYYLAVIGTESAIQFLLKRRSTEGSKLVSRGINVGLALFHNRLDVMSEYVAMLDRDQEAASINIGYHLVYYGDQSWSHEGYIDRGDAQCEGTVRALPRHLSSQSHQNGWGLDLWTFRRLLRNPERRALILRRPDFVPALAAFFGRNQQLREPAARQARLFRQMLHDIGVKLAA